MKDWKKEKERENETKSNTKTEIKTYPFLKSWLQFKSNDQVSVQKKENEWVQITGIYIAFSLVVGDLFWG